MSNTSHELSCRNVGLIIKDYSNIIDSLSKKIGVKVGERDGFGLPLGGIANPYYAENELSQWESNKYKATSSNYMDYIRKVFSPDMPFDIKSNLMNDELGINSGTLSTFDFGHTLSSILNGIQSFVTADNNNGYGSAYSKLYSTHHDLYGSGVGAVRNYNMNEPKRNINGTTDTLMANMAVVYRGMMFMDGMIQWGTDGAFADYDRISDRMSRYDFTEANYGYGLNQQFGNAGMSYVGLNHIDNIKGPMDTDYQGLFQPERLIAYKPYYEDLGWKSKSFYTTSMAFPLTGKKAKAIDPHISKGFGNGIEQLPDIVGVYPIIRKNKVTDSDTLVLDSKTIFDIYRKTYDTGNVRFRNYKMNRIVGTGKADVIQETERFQYAERDAMTPDYLQENRQAEIKNSDEEIDACEDEEEVIVRENGQAYGNFVAYGKSDTLSHKDLISHTNQAFINGDYESLVARFHTDGEDGRIIQETQTALSTQFGLSHGRNLLKRCAQLDRDTPTNSYTNPYCRVWTYHHQYHTLQNAIRGGGNGFGLNDNVLGRKTREGTADYSFRATALEEGTLFEDGQVSLRNHSVLNHANNIVNITPKDNEVFENGVKFDMTKCMFAIENLAWRDNHKMFGNENGLFTNLSPHSLGPLGGRIMWFPPYGLDFGEDVQAGWTEAGTFIGRGEPVYTYGAGTKRTGTLKFQLLIDHPSIIDYIDKDARIGAPIGNRDSVDDTGSTEQTLLRFFAGCDYLTPKNIPLTKKIEVPVVDEDNSVPYEVLEELPEKDKTEDEEKPENEQEEEEENKNHCMMFAVFFPNNYSAIYNEEEEFMYDSQSSDDIIEQNLLYLVNGIGTQSYLKDLTKEDVQSFYGLNENYAGGYRNHYNSLIPVENVDNPKQGTYKYIDTNSKLRNLPLSLETRWTVVNPKDDTSLLVKHYSAYNDECTGFTTGDSSSMKGDKAYNFGRYFGYEMGNDDCGVSRCCDDWRFFSEQEEGQNDSLSSHTTPIFMVVKKDTDDTPYYMPVIWGRWQCEGSTDVEMRNEWMYKTDNTSYRSATKSGTYRHQQEVMHSGSKKDGNFAYYHKDYADSCSNGLNSRLGLAEVCDAINNISKLDFQVSSVTDSSVVYTNGKTELISFADFMVASYVVEHNLGTEKGTNVDELSQSIALPEDTYSIDSVNLMSRILAKGKNVTVSVSGASSYQGNNRTSSKSFLNGSWVWNDADTSKMDANEKLAYNRGKSVLQYIKKVTSKNPEVFASDVIGYVDGIGDGDDHDVNTLGAKKGRCAIVEICYSLSDDESKTVDLKETIAPDAVSEYGAEAIREVSSKAGTDEISQKEKQEKVAEIEVQLPPKTRYEDEYEFFKTIDRTQPFLRDKIKEKIKYFDPAYHSISPEGFNARLTFLQQCCRQGPTYDATNSNNASNLAFGRPPVCVLRLGDFIYSRVLIESVGISYDEKMLWDLNPEGAGVQPMLATVTLKLTFLGGQDMTGPISRLQNAVSFNYYANTRVYDDRAEQIHYTEEKDPYEFDFLPNIYQ